MTVDRATYYESMWEARQRDPVSVNSPAAVPMSRGWAMYKRFNPHKELIWIEDADGKDRALTRLQADLYALLLTFIDKGTTSIRSLALTLKCSPSTVSRGIVKLVSFGLLATLTGRGRYSGTVVFRLPKDGSLDRFRKAAKAKVWEWRKAADRRVSRLELNVASYAFEGRKVRDSLYYYLTQLPSTKDATLKPWTEQDMAEIV